MKYLTTIHQLVNQINKLTAPDAMRFDEQTCEVTLNGETLNFSTNPALLINELRCFHDGAKWFANRKSLDINRFKPFGNLPQGRVREIFGFVEQPYIRLTEKQYDQLQALKCDVVVSDEGQLFTFAYTDGAKYLMPIHQEYYPLIINLYYQKPTTNVL